MLAQVTPREPPLELEPVPWLTSFLRAEYEIRRAPTPTEHLTALRSNVRQPRVKKPPRSETVLMIYRAMPPDWASAKAIAARAGVVKTTAWDAMQALLKAGMVVGKPPLRGSNHNTPWLFRRLER